MAPPLHLNLAIRKQKFHLPKLSKKTSLENFLPFKGLSRFTGGPHDSFRKGGIRDGFDVAPDVSVACSPGVRKVLDEPLVVASASGTVKKVGNERDPNDPSHSIVEIQKADGSIVGATHLDQIPVSVGDKVIGGETVIGKVSCAVPKGGYTEATHVHVSVRDKNGNQIPIGGHTFSGYTVRAAAKEYDGTMIREDGQVITAIDGQRCGPEESSIKACDGERNDLTTGAVLGESVKAPPLPTVAAAKPAPAAPPAPTREVPKPTVKAQIPAMPWAQVSLGGLAEGQTATLSGGYSREPDRGFKRVAAYLWVRNPTSSWQTFSDSPTGGLPGRAKTIDSSDFEHPADVKYSMGSLDTSLAGIPIPPKGAVRFHILTQIPETRQPKMFVLQSQKMAELFQLTLPFTEGNTPKALFERTTDFPTQSTETTLSCPRDRDIKVKLNKLVPVKDWIPYAKFDLTIHNNGGRTIKPDDYYTITETWSLSGMFVETQANHTLFKITGPSIPPDRDGVGSMGAQLAYDFGGWDRNKAPVVTYPQLVRITIHPGGRQPNQPACAKKEMLFRIDGP